MKIFISYSNESKEHSDWVGNLADDLERYEDIHVILDQYDLDVYMDKNLFMEESVVDSDVVVVVATEEYKNRANSRKKGVGFETQLAAQRHYSETENTGGSNIVVVLREPGATPNYLLSKLHIEFTEDDTYKDSLKKLISSLRRQVSRRRPKKIFSFDGAEPSEFTRVEDVLKIIYHKRQVLIDTSLGTDYSDGRRIKFELWEVKVPKTEHILVLYDHITIGQTLDRAFELIFSKEISLVSLTVIRVDDKITANFEREIKRRSPSVRLSQYTLKGFIREFCIDSELTTGHRVWEEPYFIDQPIYKSKTGEEGKLHNHAIQYLLRTIDSPTSCSAHLVIAEGGDGKSSLCSSLVNVVNNTKSKVSKSAVLLRIDEIREKISIDVANNFRISSIFNVYDLFSLLLGNSEESVSYPKISKNEFEVSVFCGNLVVVIDGLDELYSVFQDRFDKGAFLDSIQSLNAQLGESSIILTTRGNIFAENMTNLGDVQVCYLQGFDRTECKQYFSKRFGCEGDGFQLQRKCNDNVEGLIKATKVDRVSPFVVDLIGNINSEQKEGVDDNYSLKGKLYPSNADFKDKVVFHVLRREKKRQEVHITIRELVELFCEIASEYGPSISLLKLQELCEIYYEKQAKNVFEYLKINPLLEVRGDILAFRYHFLQDYFMTLFVIDEIIRQSKSPGFINAASKYADGVSASYLDILKYFREHHGVAKCCDILKKFKSMYLKDKSQQVERSISFLVHLLLDLGGSGISKSELSKMLFSCLCGNGSSSAISCLFIYGNAPPLDFSNRKFMHCGFHGYSSLLNSNLDHAFFSYTTVDIDIQEVNGLHITRDTFDSTCRIGRLSRFLREDSVVEDQGQGTDEELLRRFLWNFVESNLFVEKRTSDLVFPVDSMNTGSKFFREALRQHVIYLSKDNSKCGVTSACEKIVHNYLANSLYESRIYKILMKM